MARGGKRPGSGRPRGSINLRNRAAAEKLAVEGKTPLEFLSAIYLNTDLPLATRIDAAKACAPFVHAKLNSVAVGQDDNLGPITVAWENE